MSMKRAKAIVLENKRASLRNELQKHVMLRRKKSDVLKELKRQGTLQRNYCI